MNAPTLREALAEICGRIKCHPAYADLTEAEEEGVGGDTAEFSYLARVADEALAQHDPLELVANLLSEYGLQAMDVVAAFKAQQDDPAAWMHTDGRVVTAATMSSARRDGGAMLSSLAGYVVALYAAPQPAPVAQPLTDGKKRDLAENWFAEEWAIQKAISCMNEVEHCHKIGGPL